jgi:hypothetical protein
MNVSHNKIADGQSQFGTPYVYLLYKCLLADICRLGKVSLDTPETITDDWVLIEGPKLDKQLLSWLEHGGEYPPFPEWIKPLSERFRSSLDPLTLKYIRQLLLFCYKTEVAPTNEQLESAQAQFEETDRSIETWDTYFSTCSQAPLFRKARQIVSSVIHRIDWSSIVPSHGPGAVFPPRAPHEKSNFRTIYTPIESYYPYYEYFNGLRMFHPNAAEAQRSVISVVDNIVANLVAVPKDSRGPRLICVHPAESIWIQQGCRRLLEAAITSNISPCRGSINFTDQRVNGRLALSSSINREYVTLDLKEASDCISKELVRNLFGDYVYGILSCSRADRVRLLDKRVIELKKWAPMGNALTFPVQSLLFFSLVQAGILCRYGEYCSDIYVFGDDIIFPSKYYDGALGALIRSGLKPNIGKTFRHGFFRESCGVDAFNGVDVTPRRLKRYDTYSVTGAVSSCDLAKAMSMGGYTLTAEMMYREVQKHFGKLPLCNNPDASGLYRYESCDLATLIRYEPSLCYNRRFHRWVVKSFLVSGTNIRPDIDSWWNLQDSLVQIAQKCDGSTENSRLVYAVPRRERLVRGWLETI